MKFLANFSRILVGIEFVFSGFVKVVDPYGTGLKLQEYFEVFQKDIPALHSFFQFFADHALLLSLLFCVAELALGVALLVKFKMKWTAIAVLGLMLFFTFLTFYSAFFNKVTDCGCFGDFIKLKPWHSFYKDVISLVFIAIIYLYRKKFEKFSFSNPIFLVGLLFSLGVGIYGIKYLPLLDFLAYAPGKSLPKQMLPTNVKPDIEYVFSDKKLKKDIVSKEFLMDTLRFTYKSSEILNEDLLKPKITDFSITDPSGIDFTQYSFKGKKIFLIIKKIEGLDDLDFDAIKKVLKAASSKGVEPMVLNSLPVDVFAKLKKDKKLNYKSFTTDEKVLKTMARNNPVLLLINNGVVIKKWPYSKLPETEEIEELIKNN